MVSACGGAAMGGDDSGGAGSAGGSAGPEPASGASSSTAGAATGGSGGIAGAAIVGNGNSAGAAGSSSGPSCGQTLPCGGDVAGTTWTFVDACIEANPGASVVQKLYEEQLGCIGLELRRVWLTNVSGVIRFNADGTYSSAPWDSFNTTFAIPRSCVADAGATTCDEFAALLPNRAVALGSVQCADAEGGCSCDLLRPPGGSFEQSTYSAETGLFGPKVLTAGYCVEGDLLHVISMYEGRGPIVQDLIAVRQ
ncbi:MAG TPA: hypothetical protein VFQ35_07110 [Polyangiaceae bacterium]|nr:hypothetical protein [Polyangiaceae bacterium]